MPFYPGATAYPGATLTPGPDLTIPTPPPAAATPTSAFTIGDWTTTTDDDGHGCAWILEDCAGWDDTPDVRITFPDRPGQDGSFDAPGNTGVRVITLTGICVAPDGPGRWAAKRRLTTVGSDLKAGVTLLGAMPDGLVYAARVKRSAPTKVTNLGGTAFEYQSTFTAADPLLYSQLTFSVTATLTGVPVVTGGPWAFPMSFPYGFTGPSSTGTGTLAALNSGTAPVWPVFTFGTGDNLTVADPVTGYQLLVPHVDPGHTLVVDSGTGAVLLDGVAPRRDLLGPGSQFFPLPPEQLSVLRFYADTGGTVTMTWRSAWT